MSTDSVEGAVTGPQEPSGAPNTSSGVDDTGSATTEAQNGSEDGKPMSREQRYRMALRETEVNLTAAQETLARYQHAEAYRLAREAGLSVGANLMLSGVGLADLLAEDGSVDSEAVEAAAKAVLAERPNLRRVDPAIDITQGTGGSPKKVAPSWQSLIGG